MRKAWEDMTDRRRWVGRFMSCRRASVEVIGRDFARNNVVFVKLPQRVWVALKYERN